MVINDSDAVVLNTKYINCLDFMW